MRALSWIEQFIQDLQFGIRNLRRSPGFTAVAILSLALGIGATTAIFSVIYAVVIEPFPYKNPDTLVGIEIRDSATRDYAWLETPDHYLDLTQRSRIFDGIVASTRTDIVMTGSGEPQRLLGNFVTVNTFPILGVAPLMGRYITPNDGKPDAPAVAVISYKFWQRQFGGNPGIIGKNLRLNDMVRTVVGIMPPRFLWRGADVWLPIVFQRGHAVEDVHFAHIMGRLKPGVTQAQAETDIRPIIDDFRKIEPRSFPEKYSLWLVSFKEMFASALRQSLFMLFAAVGLLLAIACANVSNLMLARATARQREMAVRVSLGAGRFRIIRQLLTESSLIALAGAILGTALAFGGLQAIIALIPPDTIPDESKISLNMLVLLFTLAVCVLAALLAGLAPAFQAAKSDVAESLKDAGKAVSGGFRHARLRNVFVAAEVALSLILLIGASLMIRTLFHMQSMDLGYQTDHVLTMRIPLPEKRYSDTAKRVAFFDDLLRRVRQTPGVKLAAVNASLHPFGGWGTRVQLPGQPENKRFSRFHQISADYMQIINASLVSGRWLSEQDIAASRHVALVNQSFVKRYFGTRESLGQIVQCSVLRQIPSPVADDSFEIVGVVQDRLNSTYPNPEIMPEIYIPYTITGLVQMLSVATSVPPSQLTKAIQKQVYEIDKDQPVMQPRTADVMLNESLYARPRFNLFLLSIFGGLGLALAAIGVFGVMNYSVTRRTQEIGVRVALGAQRSQIVRLVLRSGLLILVAGTVLGLLGSFFATRFLTSMLWGVTPLDPLSFGAVTVLIFLIGFLACLWPARRASRIDPMVALRYE